MLFKVSIQSLIIFFIVVLPRHAFSDRLVSSDGPIRVSFHYGDTVKETLLAHGDLYEIFQPEHLPKHLILSGYKIDIWVVTALQKLKLSFDGFTKRDGSSLKTTITDIEGYKNNNKCRWVYYVNGFKSPYHISTQVDLDVETIKFVYEC